MGLNIGVCLVEARTRMGVAERLLVLLLVAALCSSQLLVDYRIVPYTGDLSRFATLVLLRPAHCLFEMWAAQTPNWKDRPHSTMSIVVDVLREDNSTFILPQKYPVPLCKDFPRAPLEPAYQMGPRIACRNGSCIENVLPGQAFRIRYTLQDVSGKPLIMTQWSDSISTKDEPASYVSIQVWDAGLRSGSMVVITVLLAVAVFILIVGFVTSVTMGWR